LSTDALKRKSSIDDRKVCSDSLSCSNACPHRRPGLLKNLSTLPNISLGFPDSSSPERTFSHSWRIRSGVKSECSAAISPACWRISSFVSSLRLARLAWSYKICALPMWKACPPLLRPHEPLESLSLFHRALSPPVPPPTRIFASSTRGRASHPASEGCRRDFDSNSQLEII
jgi:hypothetical protein